MASSKVGKRVLVEMVQSRKKVTVHRDDIQRYHKDLNGVLIVDKQNIIKSGRPSPFHLQIGQQDWPSALYET